jgi:hypothetical protein
VTQLDPATGHGGDPWDSGSPDGRVTITDVSLMVAQFGHTCAT